MLVKFKRNWFGPDGKTYKGLDEVPNDYADQLPTDAIVMSDDGTLPSNAVPVKAGFGAKPEFEQVLDQIPYAAPTHMISHATGGEGIHPPKSPGPLPTAENALEDAQRQHNEALDRNAARIDETRAAVAKGSEDAKVMALKRAEATGDPSAIAAAEALQPASGASSIDQKKNEDFSAANDLAEKNARIAAAESNRLTQTDVSSKKDESASSKSSSKK